ncbi:MAG: 4Fe-4S dicluster domain-containing protein [Anaerolineales bacterium]|nr:4Fe-4S dicluster domain-containing protein [Anaerolineales bacterium]
MSATTIPLEPASTAATIPKRNFMREIIEDTPGGDPHLEMCIQCGTCGGSCPSGPDMDYSPRRIFAMVEADMREEVLKSNTFWYCVSCYYCFVRCPQEVHITDIMYTLKRKAIREGYSTQSSASEAPDFSEFFVDAVKKYGRSFELGLATRYHLRHHPIGMVKMAAGMGLDMLRKGRMDLTPRRIKNIDQLQAILNMAEEIARQDRVDVGGVA